MSDQYQWWRDQLMGKGQEIHDGHPQSGFYKLRKGKDAPWLPVAIWRDENGMHCRVAAEQADAMNVWISCAKNPVAKIDAKHAFEHGSWPSDVAIGHNSGDLSLKDEIEEAKSQAFDWLRSSGIKDKTSMDMAANYRARLMELSKKADKHRDDKIRPHLEAQREINAEYKPLVDLAKSAADTIRDHLSKYMAAEEAKIRAAAAEAARVENEKRAAEYKRQQEAAAIVAALAKANEPPPPPIEAPIFVAPAEVKVQAGGQRGKKASLRDIKRYSMTDYTAAFAYAKDHPDVMAAVEKVCTAQARAGTSVPGITMTIEQVAV